ncbi:hypothetical protein H7965_19620 [Siccirubricoccus deserti]|uniref:EamA domain-containing protein n=2 Tax=Siccirubricoccus deserti TaxID=2013562 RepID=A0A9X0R0Y7_9PROT|nr:hypothetical protein [Siccirubricoccus deserti]
MRRERLVGWLCAGLLLVIWVGFHLMSRLTASQALTPWDVAALRYGGSFVAVLPLLAWRGLPRIAPARLPVLLVSAGFGFPLMAGAAPLYLPVWWLALPSAMAEAPWRVVLIQGLFHGLGASVIAMLLCTRAVAAIGPGPTTMVGAVVPALAALIAWPLLGEALPPLGLVAVLLVSAGMLLGVLWPARSR